eukprot:COSAG01_NODE_10555_length_2133_cov_162.135202_1_plen_58_part_00
MIDPVIFTRTRIDVVVAAAVVGFVMSRDVLILLRWLGTDDETNRTVGKSQSLVRYLS